MSVLKSSKLERSTVVVTDLNEQSDEKDYWLSVTANQRLEALEMMRQINYGYDPNTTRLQRVFEIAELPKN